MAGLYWFNGIVLPTLAYYIEATNQMFIAQDGIEWWGAWWFLPINIKWEWFGVDSTTMYNKLWLRIAKLLLVGICRLSDYLVWWILHCSEMALSLAEKTRGVNRWTPLGYAWPIWHRYTSGSDHWGFEAPLFPVVKEVNTQPLMQKFILSYDVYKHIYIYKYKYNWYYIYISVIDIYIYIYILSQYPTMSSLYIYVYRMYSVG